MIEQKGKFVVIEGPDGSGKSTQLKLLKKYYRESESSTAAIFTEEPGGTSLGLKLKDLMAQKELVNEPAVFMYLKLADRREHIVKLIQPALSSGKWVFSHRHTLSTYVYQCFVYGACSQEQFFPAVEPITGNLIPDLLIYLDLEPNISRERVLSRHKKGGTTFIEPQPKDYFEKIVAGYRSDFAASNLFAKKRITINAALPPEIVHKKIIQALVELT